MSEPETSSSEEEKLAALHADADKAAKGSNGEGVWWKPEPGDAIGGKLVKGYYQSGDYGINPVMVIEDHATGQVYNIGCGTKMLKEAVAEMAPGEGQLVVVQYVDSFPVESAPERSWKKWIVRVDGKPNFAYWQDAFKAFSAKQQMLAGDAETAFVSPAPGGVDESPF